MVSILTALINALFNDLVLLLEEAQWFHLANTQNEVTLELEHSLVAADLSRSFVIVRLWARHPTDGSGSTELIVSLPSLLTANFNLGVTVGQIDAQRNLDIPAITVDSDAYTTDMTFELIGGRFFSRFNIDELVRN